MDETTGYKATHVGAHDGSPAMLVTKAPFVLVNEDGFEWNANPEDWEEIE